MSVGNERYYRHKTGFYNGTKYIVRHGDDSVTCVKADRIVYARNWSAADDWDVERGAWIEITQEEAEAL